MHFGVGSFLIPFILYAVSLFLIDTQAITHRHFNFLLLPLSFGDFSLLMLFACREVGAALLLLQPIRGPQPPVAILAGPAAAAAAGGEDAVFKIPFLFLCFQDFFCLNH